MLLAVLIEKLVLRPLTNRSPMTLFMATLGLSYVVEGVAQGVMGANVHALDLGIADLPVFVGGVLISQFDTVAAITAAVLVGVLALLFDRTRIGISLRAVADNTRAALSVGINLHRIWQVVWAAAGLQGLVAGLLWGARQGAVLAVAGGAQGPAGAHHRRLHLDRRRHRRRADRGRRGEPGRSLRRPLCRRRHHVVVRVLPALVFLYIRPAGIFGERAIERV